MQKVIIFGYKAQNGEITHSDTFMDNHFGDMLVTHIEVNDSPRGHAIMLLVD